MTSLGGSRRSKLECQQSFGPFESAVAELIVRSTVEMTGMSRKPVDKHLPRLQNLTLRQPRFSSVKQQNRAIIAHKLGPRSSGRQPPEASVMSSAPA